MAVFETESFETLQWDEDICCKLQEAEREAELTDRRYSSKEILEAMREVIRGECGTSVSVTV